MDTLTCPLAHVYSKNRERFFCQRTYCPFIRQVTFLTSSGCQYFWMQLVFRPELGGIQPEPHLEALLYR